MSEEGKPHKPPLVMCSNTFELLKRTCQWPYPGGPSGDPATIEGLEYKVLSAEEVSSLKINRTSGVDKC